MKRLTRSWKEWILINNGAINFNEFISASLNDTVAKDFQRIEEAFKFFDLNGDGYIDEEELQTVLAKKEFPDLGSEVFIDAIKECDLDGDGRISYEEFLTGMGMKFNKLANKNMKSSFRNVQKKVF